MDFIQKVIAGVLSILIASAFLYFANARVRAKCARAWAKSMRALSGLRYKSITISADYKFSKRNCPYRIIIDNPLLKAPDAKEGDVYRIFDHNDNKVVRDGCDLWRCISKPDDEKQVFILAYLNSALTNEQMVSDFYDRVETHITAESLIKIEKKGALVAVTRTDWEREKERETLNVSTFYQGVIIGKPVQEGTQGDCVLIRLRRE